MLGQENKKIRYRKKNKNTTSSIWGTKNAVGINNAIFSVHTLLRVGKALLLFVRGFCRVTKFVSNIIISRRRGDAFVWRWPPDTVVLFLNFAEATTPHELYTSRRRRQQPPLCIVGAAARFRSSQPDDARPCPSHTRAQKMRIGFVWRHAAGRQKTGRDRLKRYQEKIKRSNILQRYKTTRVRECESVCMCVYRGNESARVIYGYYCTTITLHFIYYYYNNNNNKWTKPPSSSAWRREWWCHACIVQIELLLIWYNVITINR